MATRVVSGVLAIAGAVAVVVGGYLPYAEQGQFKLRVFETKEPHVVLFFAAEPAAVALAAAVLGIVLLTYGSFRITPGVLLGTGVQVALYYAGYVGYYAQSDFGPHVKAGGWVGIVGGVAIAAAGLVALAVREPSPAATAHATAPGWYADPGSPERLRYWSGSAWTDHTHPASPEPAATSSEPPDAEAPG
jgi:NhaP-type Na+/H+ or K+/H+ antiporter